MKPTSEQVRALENDLCRIKNVEWCQVHLTPQGDIEAIDVTSDTRRAPNRIVRDVEVVCRKHGIAVDHKKIGVAQMTPDPNAPSPADTDATAEAVPAVLQVVPEERRVRCSAVHTSYRGGGFVAEVELTLGALEGVPGRADGPATDDSTLTTIVARATLEAVRNLLAPGYNLLLRDVRVVDVSGGSLVVVVVDFGQGRETSRLVGSCLLDGSLHTVTVHATLDALNRRLGTARFRELTLLEGEGPEGSHHAASA